MLRNDDEIAAQLLQYKEMTPGGQVHKLYRDRVLILHESGPVLALFQRYLNEMTFRPNQMTPTCTMVLLALAVGMF